MRHDLGCDRFQPNNDLLGLHIESTARCGTVIEVLHKMSLSLQDFELLC